MPGSEQELEEPRSASLVQGGGAGEPGSAIRLHVVALGIACLAVFAPALAADFTYDDFIVLQSPEVQEFGWRKLLQPWGRHVRVLTLALDHALFGFSPLGYHVHSLLWHGACVGLLYALGRRLAPSAGVAFAAALLFAVHPIHVEAVTNVANRKELLCLAFSLLAFTAWARGLESAGRERIRWLTGAGAAWYLALNSKQVAIVLPLALVLYEALYVPRERRLLARSPRWVVGGGAAAGVLLLGVLTRVLDLGDLRSIPTLAGYGGEPTLGAFALTSARAFWIYVGLLAWPERLCPDHRVELSTSLADPAVLAGWTGLVALAALAGWLAPRARLASFGLLWLLIHYLPVSNLLPSAYVVADRYMYVPSVGFCLALAGAGDRVRAALAWRTPRLAVGIATAAAALSSGALALRTVEYNQVWRNEQTLWEYALACNPSSFQAHHHLGTIAFHLGRSEAAIRHYDRALELRPDWAPCLYNRGTTLAALGRYGEALRDLDRTIELRPNAESHFNRAKVRLALGDVGRALADYDRAIELDPASADAYTNRANARLRLGHLAQARADYEAALGLDPAHALAHYNLGVLDLRDGDAADAARHLERAAGLGLRQAAEALAHLRAARR